MGSGNYHDGAPSICYFIYSWIFQKIITNFKGTVQLITYLYYTHSTIHWHQLRLSDSGQLINCQRYCWRVRDKLTDRWHSTFKARVMSVLSNRKLQLPLLLSVNVTSFWYLLWLQCFNSFIGWVIRARVHVLIVFGFKD